MWNKLAATPGAKITQKSVMRSPLTQVSSWTEVVQKNGIDPAGQSWNATTSIWLNLVTRPPGAPTDHGHHIVMKSGAGATVQADVRKSQKILQMYDIDQYFGKENLVYAPNWPGHSQPNTTYGLDVYNAIEDETTRAAVVAELQAIALRFIRGDWP